MTKVARCSTPWNPRSTNSVPSIPLARSFTDSSVNRPAESDQIHPQIPPTRLKFSRDEFEAALKSDALVFHCNTCDADWTPSSEEIARLRTQFSKNAS